MDPTSLPNLVAWFDASNTGSITSSSSAVSQWNDLSGNGNHLTQATAGSKPLTATHTGGAGLNAVFFDNTDDNMQTSGVLSTTTITAICIGKLITDDNYEFWHIEGGYALYGILSNGGTVESYDDAFGSILTTTFPTSDTTPFVDVVRKRTITDGDRRIAALAGGTPNDATTTTFAGVFASAFIRLGASNRPLGADIYEFILYSDAKSDADRASLIQYAQAKWSFAPRRIRTRTATVAVHRTAIR